MAVEIVFTGGPECGNVGSTEWRNTGTGDSITFEVNKPVVLDPEKTQTPTMRDFMKHVIAKAKDNPYFSVEEKRGPGRPRKDEGGDE